MLQNGIYLKVKTKKFLSKITKCRQTTSAVIGVFKKFTAQFEMLNFKMSKLHKKQLHIWTNSRYVFSQISNFHYIYSNIIFTRSLSERFVRVHQEHFLEFNHSYEWCVVLPLLTVTSQATVLWNEFDLLYSYKASQLVYDVHT